MKFIVPFSCFEILNISYINLKCVPDLNNLNTFVTSYVPGVFPGRVCSRIFIGVHFFFSLHRQAIT